MIPKRCDSWASVTCLALRVRQRWGGAEADELTLRRYAPFRIFVDVGDDIVRGIVQITDFVDSGDMTPEMYPDIGSALGAVVVGYTEDDRNQVWLSVKPSVLQKALVHLKIPATSERLRPYVLSNAFYTFFR